MKRHFNKHLFVFLIGILVNACGTKNSPAGSSLNTSSASQHQLELIGSSVTKEILINTNEKIVKEHKNASLILGAMQTITDDNAKQSDESQEAVYRKINKVKNEGVYSATQSPLIKTEYNIDLGVGAGVAIASTFLSPAVLPAAALGLTFGGSALKGYLEDKRKNEIEATVATLSDRRDKDVLLLAISEARVYGEDLLKNIHAGSSPETIKETIARYQERIITNSDMSAQDMEKFYKNGNDHFLLGLALSIKENQNTFGIDQKIIKKTLKQNNDLLKEVANNSQELIEQQNKVLAMISENFHPDERSLVLNALFATSGNSDLKKQLMRPDQLEYFKRHPELIQNYNNLLNSGKLDDIIAIAKTQERAQRAYNYLQVTSQIASNLNLNPEIIGVINKGANIASAISSIASFSLTSNPLDALNALNSLTGLFSKPKPDPRFTAIFENFKAIQATLKNIQAQLTLINNKLDNIEDGLNYVIAQNKYNTDLIIERSMTGQFKCSSITNALSHMPKGDLNYFEIEDLFSNSKQGDNEKIDLCMRYMLDTFEDPFEQSKIFFRAAGNPDQESSDSELNKYFVAQSKLSFLYNKLYFYSSADLNNRLFDQENLLSVGTITAHVKQLLKSSFLFDMAVVNRERKSWELVKINDIIKTTRANKKTELLLKNALSLIEVALVQQSIIDGNIENKALLQRFLSKESANCSEERNFELLCLAQSNSTLLHNLTLKSLRQLIGRDFFEAWLQIAKNNPNHLNEKLAGTPLKIVWVGNGASDLFSGDTFPSTERYADGAYIQINKNLNLIPLPNLSMFSAKGPLYQSGRVTTLQNLKQLIENELIERNMHNILSSDELKSYNSEKRKQILNQVSL